MPYIGNPIYQSAFVTDQFNGDGSTVAFTMSVAPAGVSNVLVAVSGVLQDPSTYGVAGNTITFSTAPPSGTGNISCRYLGVPVTGIVTTAYRTVTEFTATASQTTFTPPSYTVGFINVYLNGVLLGSADYTATNGTTVVLATGASAGNLVTVESFRVDSVLNAIPNTAGSVSSSNIQTSVALTTPTMTSPTISSGALTIGTTSLGQGNASSFKNRIINGNMVIDQRNAGASFTPLSTNTFTLDRWINLIGASSKFSVQQNAGSVTPPVGFTNYYGVTSLSAYSLSSSDYEGVGQKIEGYNVADLGFGTANAKTVTVSFWVRSSLTGTFGGSLLNSAQDRAYPFTYTISSANTWEYKTVTIPGDTSGTWLTTNGAGMFLNFNLGTGSTYSGPAGAWAGSNYLSATGATSVVSTNGATWYITGVQLEVGSTATSFDYRPYGTELALCQRYFQIYKGSDPVANNYVRMGYGYINASGSNGLVYITNRVNMRTQPSITASGSFTFYNGTFYSITTGNIALDGATTTQITGLNISGSGFPSSGVFVDFITNNSSTSFLAISAEL